jgi:hypothetical protein
MLDLHKDLTFSRMPPHITLRVSDNGFVGHERGLKYVQQDNVIYAPQLGQEIDRLHQVPWNSGSTATQPQFE